MKKYAFVLLLAAFSMFSGSAAAKSFDRAEMHRERLAGIDLETRSTTHSRPTMYGTATADGDILISESIAPARFFQDDSRVTALADGGWLVVWTDGRQGSRKIYGQLFDDLGSVTGGNFLLAGSASGNNYVEPKVACDTLGRIFLVYRDQTAGLILARRYNSDLTIDLDEFLVNDTTLDSFAGPFDFDIYPNGRVVVAWENYTSSGSSIAMRIYNTLGEAVIPASVANNDGGNNLHWVPSVAVRPGAGYLIAWEDYRNGNADIYARLFDGNGGGVGTDFALVPTPSDAAEQYASGVTYSSTHNYVVGWLDQREGQQIYAQQYSPAVGLVGGNVRISESDSLAVNWDVDLATTPSGTVYISWAAFGEQSMILTVGVDQSLQPLGPIQQLNSATVGGRWAPSRNFAESGSSGFVWSEIQDGDPDIVFDLIDANGTTVVAQERIVNDDQVGAPSTTPQILAATNWYNLIAYTDQRRDVGDIYLRAVSNAGILLSGSRRVNQDPGLDRQSQPSLAKASDSSFLIVWVDNRELGGTSGQRIFGRSVTQYGSFRSDEFVVSDSIESAVKSGPVAALAPDGSGLVVWIDHRDGTPQVYGKWLTTSASPSGADIGFSNPATDLDNAGLHIGRDGTGNVYLIWVDRGVSPATVKGQWYLSTHSVGGSFSWTPDIPGVEIEALSATVTTSGDIAMLWDGYNGAVRRLYLNVIDREGTGLSGTIEVTDDPSADPDAIDLAVDDHGYFSAAWTDIREGSRRVFYQIYQDDLTPLGANQSISPADPEFMMSPSTSAFLGRAWFAWVDPRQDGLNVYASTIVYLPTDVGDDDRPTLPVSYTLGQNYPNPFNPSTVITFSLPRVSDVTLTIFNTLGRKVRTLVSGGLVAGTYSITWDGRDDSDNQVASGVYLYRLDAGDFTDQRKMVLIK